jgi:GcrA cell cycle regulator
MINAAQAQTQPLLTTRSGGLVWTDDMVRRLKELVAGKNSGGGCTAALNSEFGLKLTRNSIMGKANRLKLRLESQARNTLINRRETKKIAPPRPKRVSSSAAFVRGSITPPRLELLETTQSDWETPQEQRKSFMQLEAHNCRWGVGDVGNPDFFFCGGGVKEGSPYCDHHHARAHWRY